MKTSTSVLSQASFTGLQFRPVGDLVLLLLVKVLRLLILVDLNGPVAEALQLVLLLVDVDIDTTYVVRRGARTERHVSEIALIEYDIIGLAHVVDRWQAIASIHPVCAAGGTVPSVRRQAALLR